MTISTLKAFLFTSALLAVVSSDTCTDCTAVVSTIAARLLSEESLAVQGVVFLSPNDSNFSQAILAGGLCPGAEDVAQCEANLALWWKTIAALLWPGYWDPTVS